MAKHFQGGAPIHWLQTLGRRELMRWYAVYERQSVEEEIANEYLYPPAPQKSKPVPPPRRMRVLVDQRIAERREREEEERAE